MEESIIRSTALSERFTGEQCFIAEVMNRTACPGLSVARARVRPGVTTMWHRLRGTIEVYYILEGTGEMEISGRSAGIVRPNDLVFIPADADQRIRNISEKDLVFLCICSPRFQPDQYIESENPIANKS